MKKSLIFTLIVGIIFFAPASVFALGQMSQPINISDGLRGQKINQQIIVINNEQKKAIVEFSASGQIKDWVKFYNPQDLKNPVSTSSIEVGKNLSMTAVFSIPNDVPNGEYKGLVSVSSVPDQYVAKEQSSASVRQKIDRQVAIKISDSEVLKLDVSVIPETYDLTLNQPLNVRIIYDNQSNIRLTPSISFKIKQNEQTVYNVIYPYPDNAAPVNSKGNFEIPALKIPTDNLAKGEYYAQLQFLKGDKVLVEKQFGFSIGGGAVFSTTGIRDIFKNNLVWLFGLIALMILALIAWQAKKNPNIKKDIVKRLGLKRS